MEVSRLCDELDDAKAEIEKLKNDLKRSKEEYERLRKFHGDQAIQLKEGERRIAVQAADISGKFEEIHELRSEIDKLGSNLLAKDSAIKQLNAANELARRDSLEKIMRLEEEKREILETLDVATSKIENIEAEMKSIKEESEGLRKVVSDTRKKNEQLERNAKSPQVYQDAWLTLEDKKLKIEEELKWKKEQFKHLQEAHEKIKQEFNRGKKEWERELSTLIDKVCSLEEKLDSETRIAEDSRKRLMMSNQALAREESRRKSLEVELSEIKSRFHNAFIEFDDTKLQLEKFTTQRDNDIALLASSLSHKEIVCREMQHKIAHLEQENHDLLESLKETREEIIRVASSSSQRRQGKPTEKIGLQELERKNAAIKTLRVQLEQCFFEIEQVRSQRDESDLTLLVLKSILPEMNKLRLEELEQKEEIIQTLQSQIENCFRDIEQLRSDLVLLRMKASTEKKSEIGFEELQLKEATVKSLQLEMEECFSEMEQMKLQKEESDFTIIAMKSSFDEIKENSKIMMELHTELDVVKSELNCERLKSIFINEEFSRQQAQLENARRSVLELQDKLVEKASSLELIKQENEITKQDLDARREKLEYIGENLAKACDALDEANAELAIAKKNAIYTKELEQTNAHLQKEVRSCKERLKESFKHEIHFKQQATRNEKELRDNVRKLRGDLEEVNNELVAEIWENHSANFELWIWKSIAEKMKAEAEEGIRLRKKVESSLIAQIEDGEYFKRENRKLKKEMENLEFIVLHKEVEALILRESCESVAGIMEEMELKEVMIEDLRDENTTLVGQMNEMRKQREQLMEALITIDSKMFMFSCEEAKILEEIETIVNDAGGGKENELRFSSPKQSPVVHRERLPFQELN